MLKSKASSAQQQQCKRKRVCQVERTRGVKDTLVPVDLRLEWALDWQTKVISLLLGKLGELSVDVVKVQKSDLLVEDLWQGVDANVELAGLAELDILVTEGLVLCLVEQNLGKDLVGERAGHDEGGVAGGASQVDETALSEEDDVVAIWHEEAVDLWLDRDHALGVGLEPGDIDLNVEVTDVADDGIVLHD